MDLIIIRQQILSSNTYVREKAEALLLERMAYDMSKDEWRDSWSPRGYHEADWRAEVSRYTRPLVCITLIIKA